MTRFLLDTNVVSDAIRPQPSPIIATWFSNQVDSELFISSFTIAEIKRGVLEKTAGRKQRELEAWFAGSEGPVQLFAGRVLAFDERATLEWASIMARGTEIGRPRSPLDMLIAATALANDCVVATLNQRHFEGVVDFFNPLDQS